MKMQYVHIRVSMYYILLLFVVLKGDNDIEAYVILGVVKMSKHIFYF